MRAAACLAALGLAGCSFLFQEHLSDHHSPDSEPVCDDSSGWPLIDSILASLALAGIVTAIATGDTGNTEVIGGGALDLTVFGISAVAGSHWADQCGDAIHDWKISAAIAKRDAREKELAERDERERARDAPVAKLAKLATSTPAPRGFFCVSSLSNTATGFCTRERPACEQARSAVVSTITDITPCSLVETAQCADDLHCAPTVAACEAMRSTSGLVDACSERK